MPEVEIVEPTPIPERIKEAERRFALKRGSAECSQPAAPILPSQMPGSLRDEENPRAC